MKLHLLPKTTTKPKKRLGRGYGSGKGGHTVGRGQKGQKTRGSIPQWFIGSSKVWFKHLPMTRGKSRQSSLQSEEKLITLNDLNKLKAGVVVTPEVLVEAGVITVKEMKRARLKVVGNGKVEKALTLAIPVTRAAAEAIRKSGGAIQGETV